MNEKNPAAVALGRLGGRKGGPARAASLTPEQRAAAAKKAAKRRWAGHRRKGRGMAERPLPLRLREAVWTRDGARCQGCGCACVRRKGCPKELRARVGEVDHVDPWSKGGRHVLTNLRLLCRTCNRRKGVSGAEFYAATG